MPDNNKEYERSRDQKQLDEIGAADKPIQSEADQKLAKALRRAVTSFRQEAGGVSKEKLDNISYYKGRTNDEIPTRAGMSRCNAVFNEVGPAVDQFANESTDIFMGPDGMDLEIIPMGIDDVDAAEQNAMMVEHVVRDWNDGRRHFKKLFKMSAANDTGYMFALPTYRYKVWEERHKVSSMIQLQQMKDRYYQQGIECEVKSFEVSSEEQKEYIMSNAAMQAGVTTSKEMEAHLTLTCKKKNFRIDLHNVSKTELISSKDGRGNMQMDTVVGYPKGMSIGTLMNMLEGMGVNHFTKEQLYASASPADDIQTAEKEIDETTDTLSDASIDEILNKHTDTAGDFDDILGKRITVHFCWYRNDYDKDGIEEKLFCILLGDIVVYHKPVVYTPGIEYKFNPEPDTDGSTSLTERVSPYQVFRTAVMRSTADYATEMNKINILTDEHQFHVEDVLQNSSGIWRMKKRFNPARFHVIQRSQNSPQSIFPLLQEAERSKVNNTGFAHQGSIVDQEAIKTGTSGDKFAMMQSASHRNMNSVMADFASGPARELVAIIMNHLLEFGSEPDVQMLAMKLTDKPFKDYERALGQHSQNLEYMIKVGVGLKSKQERIADAIGMRQLQQDMEQYGFFVPEEKKLDCYNNVAKARGLSVDAQRFLPTMEEHMALKQQAMQQQEEQAMKQEGKIGQLVAADEQRKDTEVQVKVQDSQTKQIQASSKAQSDHVKNLETVEMLPYRQKIAMAEAESKEIAQLVELNELEGNPNESL